MGERLLLESHVGVEIHLVRLQGLVAEPERNDAAVHALSQHLHRGRVAQRMGSDLLFGKRGAACGRRRDMFAHEPLQGVRAETTTVGAGEDEGYRVWILLM